MSGGIQTASHGSVTERYEALLRVSQVLISNRNSEELFSILVRELREVVEFSYLGVGIYDEKLHEVRFKRFDRAGSPMEVPGLAPEETPTWHVYKNQRPVVIPVLEEETRFPAAVELMKKDGVRSVCELPLTTGRRRLGDLAVGSQEPDAYSSEEVSFLSLVANQVALAIDAALSFEASERAQQELRREHAELQVERDRLQLLLNVTNQVVSNLELRDLLRAVSASVRRVMQCAGVSVALLDSGNKQLRVYALDLPEGKGLAQEEDLIPFGEDSSNGDLRWVTRVLRTGQPLSRQARDIAGLNAADSMAAAEGFQSDCLLPLISRNRPLGVLVLGRREDKAFSQDEVAFLMQVANQVAIAIENATAYQQIADLKDKLAQEKLYLEDDPDRNEVRTDRGEERCPPPDAQAGGNGGAY